MISAWAGQNGWTIGNANHIIDLDEMIIILRDPVDRWISGISQYINTYILHPHGPNGPIFPGELVTEHDRDMDAEEFMALYNPLVERLFFDVIDRFDDHVLAQADYLQCVKCSIPKKFFLLGRNTTQQISEYFKWQMPVGINENSGSDHAQIQKLQKFFKTRLEQRPELVPRLYKHYRLDVELLTLV